MPGKDLKNTGFVVFLWALLLGLLAAGACAAGLAGGAVVVIDTVEVRSTPIMAEQDITLYGGATTSVGRKQIQDLNAHDLPSALRLLPGVTISRYNLLGSYGGGEGGSVYIRGQGAGRPGSEVKIYVDGAPREVGVWSHPVMDIVPTDYASSIDVYKGPQPASFSGAFGTVELRTMRRVQPGYETSLDLFVGEYDSRGGVIRHGGKVRCFDYYVGGSYKSSDGHRPHADGRMGSLFLRLGADVQKGLHLGYTLQHTDNWSRDPGRTEGPTPERNSFATNTLTHNIRLDNGWFGMSGYATLYYEDGRIRWKKDHIDDLDGPAGSSDTDWRNYGFRGSEDIVWRELGVTVGLELENEGGEFRNTTLSGYVPFEYEGRFTTAAPALAARYEVDLGSGTLVPSLGLRYYDHSRFASESAPHAGLIYRWRDYTAFATYARGVSYPGVYSLGVASSTVDSLEAEVLDHFEAGVNVSWGARLRLQASVFNNRADNLMQWTPAGLINIREYEVSGFELSAAMDMRSDFSLYVAGTLLDPTKERTPRAPKFSGSARANFAPLTWLRLTLDLEYVDDQYAYNARSGEGAILDIEMLPSYFVASAGVGFPLMDSVGAPLALSLEIENLTDEAYSFQPGYPMPGRTLSLTARMGIN